MNQGLRQSALSQKGDGPEPTWLEPKWLETKWLEPKWLRSDDDDDDDDGAFFYGFGGQRSLARLILDRTRAPTGPFLRKISGSGDPEKWETDPPPWRATPDKKSTKV